VKDKKGIELKEEIDIELVWSATEEFTLVKNHD
jgi:hypothetical protein